MTDTAVIDGGAPAPAEPSAAPINLDQTNPSNPLGSQVLPKDQPDPKPEAEKKEATPRDAVKRAMDAVKAKEQAKAVEAKAEPAQPDKAVKEPEKPARERGDDGKFSPQKQPETAQPVQSPSAHREAPSRFSPDAKAAWETTPEPVRAEVHRAIRELEQGHQKYKADAEAYAEIREYSDLAKQHGTSVKTALDNYVGIERMLAQNPVAGLERIMQNLNIRTQDGRMLTLRDVAAHVLNQTPDQVASQQASVIQELRAEISGLKQQLGGVSQTIEQQRESAVYSEISAFAAKPEHSRFAELQSDITFFLNSGRVPENLPPYERLSEAYKLAERLNPGTAKASPPAPATPAPAAPLNPAGQKSVSGAPAAGSDPVTLKSKGPAPSIRDALKRANARAS